MQPQLPSFSLVQDMLRISYPGISPEEIEKVMDIVLRHGPKPEKTVVPPDRNRILTAYHPSADLCGTAPTALLDLISGVVRETGRVMLSRSCWKTM